MRCQILIGEESEVGELDDESVHGSGRVFIGSLPGRDIRKPLPKMIRPEFLQTIFIAKKPPENGWCGKIALGGGFNRR